MIVGKGEGLARAYNITRIGGASFHVLNNLNSK